MRQILFAGKKAQKWPALERDMIADSAPQHGVARLERIEYRTLRHRSGDFEDHLVADVRQVAEMVRKSDADHVIVCTSTESTAGKSRTIGFQLSPASAEQYTCPPVVPK